MLCPLKLFQLFDCLSKIMILFTPHAQDVKVKDVKDRCVKIGVREIG